MSTTDTPAADAPATPTLNAPQPVTFSVEAGHPIIVHVTRGSEKFLLRVGLAIFNVRDSGRTAQNGIPLFEVQAAIAVNTEKE